MTTSTSEHIGGRLSEHFAFWKSITHNNYILECISGAVIPFDRKPPVQHRPCPELIMNTKQMQFVDNVLLKLLDNRSIIKLDKPFDKGWVSNIFLVPKKLPGEYRLILNLKPLNKFVTYKKFKMDHIEQVLNMITEHCFLGSVDLQQAFNHIKISLKSIPYLMFMWRKQYYCYTCAPNGLSNCPYMFSKVCKPLLAYL